MEMLAKQDGSVIRLALLDDVDLAAENIVMLRELGVEDRDITVLSGIPYPEPVLGRPMTWERLPLIALSGAAVGFLIGVFLNAVTPLLYPIRVGGQPYIAIPPALVLTYEFTMMGLIVSTFLGVLWESTFPSFGPKYYHPRISEGYIGILFKAPKERLDEIVKMFHARGVQEIVEPEEWSL